MCDPYGVRKPPEFIRVAQTLLSVQFWDVPAARLYRFIVSRCFTVSPRQNVKSTRKFSSMRADPETPAWRQGSGWQYEMFFFMYLGGFVSLTFYPVKVLWLKKSLSQTHSQSRSAFSQSQSTWLLALRIMNLRLIFKNYKNMFGYTKKILFSYWLCKQNL